MANTNALEPIVIRREQKTLAFSANLAVPGESDKNTPLQHPGYSRFTVTIIDKTSGSTIFPHANIPQSDISVIWAKKNGVVSARTMYEMLGSHNTTAAPAASGASSSTGAEDPVLGFGRYKGKTVSQAVAEMTAEECRNQAAFFKSNVDRYPRNQVFIDAFERAAREKEGDSSEEPAEKTSSPAATGFGSAMSGVTLYEQKHKFLRSTADEKGNVLVYSISIKYNPAMRYPYVVAIENGYAPITERESGAFNVKESEMVNKQSASIFLTADEAEAVIDRLYAVSQNFDAAMFAGQYRKAKALSATAANVSAASLAKAEDQYVSVETLKAEKDRAEILQMLEDLTQMLANK